MAILLGFPIQEMHVILQMSSGSVQRSLRCIIDYIQLPLTMFIILDHYFMIAGFSMKTLYMLASYNTILLWVKIIENLSQFKGDDYKQNIFEILQICMQNYGELEKTRMVRT